MGEWECMCLAERQHGLVERKQVLQCGLTRAQINRRLKKRVWVHVHPGVYRMSGAPEGWLQQVRAALLWAGPPAIVSHQTAAALWGFPRVRTTSPIHVSMPFSNAAREVRVHQVAAFTAREVTSHRGFKLTAVTRTLLDLSATESERDAQACADWALANKLTTLDRLRVLAETHPHHRGVVFLRGLVHKYEGGDGPSESELEARVFELLDDEGLPRPERQRAVYVGGKLRRLDFIFTGTKVVIEADGYAWHASPASFEKDRERANSLAIRGYTVLHWTWRAMEDRRQVLVTEVCRALQLAVRQVA